ncbi:transcription factor IIIB 50 kDa subunit [Corythoichthys intestinalis]|uniref:transcription factor IIIB 50 kDa subunit n=1 Tax=Corythoichthys intestinalis TaxID=161448 RepID=UPI0025A50179|nr:transcription factor IIIB 50 kDa subunit [Corythoichthys intestinalis]
MSAGSLKCPCCGSSSVVEDDHYAQRQKVCADCGTVVTEGALTHDTFEGTDVSYSRTTAVVKKPCLNQIKGQQRLTTLCRVLRVNTEIETLASTYFGQAYEHESFLRVSLQKKDHLAGCCVLVSCRQLNWPITMGTIACLLEADIATLGAVYQEMVKVLKIEAPLVSVNDVMEAHCQEYKIASLDVHEDLAENHKDLNKRALSLVELAADSWIVTGRNPIPLMMAAVYLAWQSLNTNHIRLKTSLDKFCLIAKVRKNRTAAKRVGEIKEVLCKLGKEIPWVTDSVTLDNVAWHVGDIVKNRYALLQRALRSHEEAMQVESQHTSDMANPSEPEDQTQYTSIQNSEDCNQPAEDQESSANQNPESNWGKRMLFAPPCVIHPKRRKVALERREDVTGDEEISDSEIDSYIRTPREAREFALTQKAWASLSEKAEG